MSKSPKPPLTNARFAFAVAHIARTANNAITTMVEGMWNPDFCSAPAEMYALSVVEDLEPFL